jgi:hypothetical protein
MSSNAMASNGQCSFIMENPLMSPTKTCVSPITETECKKYNESKDNTDVQYDEGECSLEKSVGYCDAEEKRTVYYEGDPSQLQMGCAFQDDGGDWFSKDDD